MSIKLMSQVWGKDLPQNQKLVLLAFADHADDEGLCFPSIKRVAWKTGYSRRAVQRIVRALEEADVIELAKEAPGVPGRPRVYLLNIDAAVDQPPFVTGDKTTPVEERGASSATGTGDKSSATGDTSGATGDVATTPESSLEPSLETSKNRASRSLKKNQTSVKCHDCGKNMMDEGDVLACPDPKCGTYIAVGKAS